MEIALTHVFVFISVFGFPRCTVKQCCVEYCKLNFVSSQLFGVYAGIIFFLWGDGW